MLSQQGLAEALPVESIADAPAQWALPGGESSRAGYERRQADARRKAPEVAGEDGEFHRGAAAGVEQLAGGVADPEEAVRVRGVPREYGRGQELAPVGRQDGDWHDEDST